MNLGLARLLIGLLVTAGCQRVERPASAPTAVSTEREAIDSTSDVFCQTPGQMAALKARVASSNEATWTLIRHYQFCEDGDQDLVLLDRLIARNDPKAMAERAVISLNTNRELDRVLPLLKRAAALGDRHARETLESLEVDAAVAQVFAIERIRPKVEVLIPASYRNMTAQGLKSFCGSTGQRDQQFCHQAVFQVSVEANHPCRGDVNVEFEAINVAALAQARVWPGDTPVSLVRREMRCVSGRRPLQ